MDRLTQRTVVLDETPSIFGRRPIVMGNRIAESRFNDDSWDLTPIQSQVHLKAPILLFAGFPGPFKSAAKELALALLQHEPDDGHAPRSPSTIVTLHYSARHFFVWLHEQGIAALSAVEPGHLLAYRNHFIAKGEKVSQKVSQVLNALYFHRERMQDALTTDPRALFRARRHTSVRHENATPRIPEAALGPLIRWAERWVTVFADDVIAAKHEFEATRSRSPKRGNAAPGADGYDALLALLAEYRRLSRPLPARKDSDDTVVVNLMHLAREANCTMDAVQRLGRADVDRAVDDLGLGPGLSLWHVPRATLDDDAWLETISFWEVQELARHLMTSCYILIAMFSGMRDAEIKHLKRGSLTVERPTDGRAPRSSLRSLAFKNEPSMGTSATWRIGDLAAAAVGVLERLQPDDEELLFAKLRLQRNTRPNAAVGANRTRTARETSEDLNAFATWTNTYCESRQHTDVIPEFHGAPWRFTTRQFRRTLAWFIARRPGGTIAGAIQFRHLSVQMFEGYAGTSRSGFRAEVEGEEALARGEYLLAIVDRHEHDTLTGPAASTGRARLERFAAAAAFRGVVAESPVQLARLLETEDPAIYTNDLVTCVFDPERALCLRNKQGGRPDLAQCEPTRCGNVAVTKDNVEGWRRVIQELDETLGRAEALPPYVATRLREARSRMVRRFTTTGREDHD